MAEMKIVGVPPQFKAMLKSQAALASKTLSVHVLEMLAAVEKSALKLASKPKKDRP